MYPLPGLFGTPLEQRDRGQGEPTAAAQNYVKPNGAKGMPGRQCHREIANQTHNRSKDQDAAPRVQPYEEYVDPLAPPLFG